MDTDPKIEDALVEYFERLDRGESVDAERFLSRYPELAEELRTFLQMASIVEEMAGPTIRESQLVSDTSRIGDTQFPLAAPPLANELLPGSEFGRYRIEHKLGQGAMGTVYLAYDGQLDRQVAIKIPVFDQEQAPEMIERFYREARVAAKVRSPHICPVYDVAEHEGTHFIAMAYIEGQTLGAWARQRVKRDPHETAVIIQKLALAMQKAHEAGVIHRDLKPGNVMMDQDGQPIIMDFGLARHIGQTDLRQTKAGTLIGSPAYMAPEQVLGDESKIGPVSDVYALGVILYELATGRLPYRGSVISVIGQIVAGNHRAAASLIPEADEDLAAICERMMAARIEARFTSMQEAAGALEAYLQGRPLQFGRPAALQPDKPPVVQPAAMAVVKSVDETISGSFHDASHFDDDSSSTGIVVLSLIGLLLLGVFGIGSLGVVWYFSIPESMPTPGASVAAVKGETSAEVNSADVEISEETVDRSSVPSPEPPPPSPSTDPQPATPAEPTVPKFVPATGNAANASPPTAAAKRGLQYRWRKGQQFGYKINITIKSGGLNDTLSGYVFYKVTSSDKREATLLYTSQLAAHQRGGMRIGPPGFDRLSELAPLAEMVQAFPEHSMTMDSRGRVIESGCHGQLSFGLGSLPRLIFPVLPQKSDKSWTNERAIEFQWERSTFPLHPFHRGPFGVDTGSDSKSARLKSQCQIEGTYPHGKVIEGQLSAHAGAHALTGDVTWRFDTKQSIVEDAVWNLKVTTRSGPLDVKVSFEQASEADLAQRFARATTRPTEAESEAYVPKEIVDQPPTVLKSQQVLATTKLESGDALEGYRRGRWQAATVVEVLDNGQVKVHWVGYGSELDEVLTRPFLRRRVP